MPVRRRHRTPDNYRRRSARGGRCHRRLTCPTGRAAPRPSPPPRAPRPPRREARPQPNSGPELFGGDRSPSGEEGPAPAPVKKNSKQEAGGAPLSEEGAPLVGGGRGGFGGGDRQSRCECG